MQSLNSMLPRLAYMTKDKAKVAKDKLLGYVRVSGIKESKNGASYIDFLLKLPNQNGVYISYVFLKN